MGSEQPDSDIAWTAAVRRLQWHLYCRDVEPWREPLTAYCLRLAADDRSSAEDLVQETLLRGFGVVSQLARGLDRPRAFLFRVATNLWIDRQRKPLLLAFSDEEYGSGADDDEGEIECQLAEAAQMLSKIVPPAERRAFVLTVLYGHTGQEAARLLGCSAAAVKMAACRARRRIQRSGQARSCRTPNSMTPPDRKGT